MKTTAQITATLPREVKDKLDTICKRERRSLSNMVAIIIEKYVEKEGKS